MSVMESPVRPPPGKPKQYEYQEKDEDYDKDNLCHLIERLRDREKVDQPEYQSSYNNEDQ
jgi:hypothetical protein